MYSNFVNTIKSEMDRYLLPVQNKTKRSKSHSYWNSELNDLWKHKKNAERTYRKCKNNEKNDKRLLFKTACNIFDRKLRCLERNFKRNEMTQIELLQFRNPKQFWDEIKN